LNRGLEAVRAERFARPRAPSRATNRRKGFSIGRVERRDANVERIGSIGSTKPSRRCGAAT